MPHSCVGVLFSEARGDSESEAVSAGVVEVAASCSAGGFLLTGGGLLSQLLHSPLEDSKPVYDTVYIVRFKKKNTKTISETEKVQKLTEEILTASQRRRKRRKDVLQIAGFQQCGQLDCVGGSPVGNDHLLTAKSAQSGQHGFRFTGRSQDFRDELFSDRHHRTVFDRGR